MTGAGRPPSEQWWVINGEDLLSALRRSGGGDSPEIVYLELVANSDTDAPDATHPTPGDDTL